MRARAAGPRLPVPSRRPRSVFTGSSASAASVRPAPGPQRRKRRARPWRGRRSPGGCRRDPAPGPPLAVSQARPGGPARGGRRVPDSRDRELWAGCSRPREGRAAWRTPSHVPPPEAPEARFPKRSGTPAIRVPGGRLSSASPRSAVDFGGAFGERGQHSPHRVPPPPSRCGDAASPSPAPPGGLGCGRRRSERSRGPFRCVTGR